MIKFEKGILTCKVCKKKIQNKMQMSYYIEVYINRKTHPWIFFGPAYRSSLIFNKKKFSKSVFLVKKSHFTKL